MFVKNTLDQGTDEWLAWRDNGVGASEVKIVKGNCPHKTRWTLWAEKKGLVKLVDLSRNPHVRRGNRLEDPVRRCVEKRFGVNIDVFCGHDSDHPWRLVSFDGVIADGKQGIPVEIKCSSTKVTGEETEEELLALSQDRFIDLEKNGRNSKLFDEYIDQHQYQIGMLDAPYGYLVFYFEFNNEMRIFKVPRDDQLIAENFEAVDDFFHNHIRTGVPPEKDPDRDYYEPSEEELVDWDAQTMQFFEAVKEERELKRKLKEVKSQRDEAANYLLEQAGNFKMLSLHGIKITSVKARETFQYSDFLEHKGISITETEKKKFTKIGKSGVRVSTVSNKELEEIKNKNLQHQRQYALELLFGQQDDNTEGYVYDLFDEE